MDRSREITQTVADKKLPLLKFNKKSNVLCGHFLLLGQLYKVTKKGQLPRGTKTMLSRSMPNKTIVC